MKEYGKLVSPMLVGLNTVKFKVSEPGRVYHLHIITTGIAGADETADVLTRELKARFSATVKWIGIEGSMIDVQLEGSPFIWVALIAALPLILSLVAVSMILVSIYSAIMAMPPYAWALLAIGVGILVFMPGIISGVSSTGRQIRVIRGGTIG